MFKYIVLFSGFAVLVFTYAAVVSADTLLAESNSESSPSESTIARCFSFTWLGPSFNNESIFINATCADATKLADGVPCVQPLVVSEDSSWPDVDYIWRNHRLQATCVMNDNVCAQYSYYFNGQPENSTYMCTRAVDNRGIAITSGCYQQVNGSSTTRVCFCQSIRGGVPCNDAVVPTASSVVLLVASLTLILRNIVVEKST